MKTNQNMWSNIGTKYVQRQWTISSVSRWTIWRSNFFCVFELCYHQYPCTHAFLPMKLKFTLTFHPKFSVIIFIMMSHFDLYWPQWYLTYIKLKNILDLLRWISTPITKLLDAMLMKLCCVWSHTIVALKWPLTST